MKIGPGERDITQGRHFEEIVLGRIDRYRAATPVGRRPIDRAGIGHDAEFLIHRAAQVDARVASNTALVHEQSETGLLVAVKRCCLAAQEPFERSVVGDQGRLIGGDGLLHVPHRDRVFDPWISRREERLVVRQRKDLFGHVVERRRHLDRID